MSRINKSFLLASLVFFASMLALMPGLVSASGPAFNTTSSTPSIYGCTISWDTVFGNSTTTVMQTNYTVLYALSGAAANVTGCSNATQASGVKTCVLGSLNRAKVYDFYITACNWTICNTTQSSFNTLSYANVNQTESIGSSVILDLKGIVQFVAYTIDSALDTSSGMIDLIVIAIVLVIFAYAMYWAVKAKRNLK